MKHNPGFENKTGELVMRNCIPGNQTPPEPGILPTGEAPGYTTPSLFQQIATLRRPLTREGRQRIPGWYLVRGNNRPRRIAPAPPQAPLSEKMKRRCVGAANVLLWPMLRALTALYLFRHGLERPSALAMWRDLDARRCAGNRGQAPIGSMVPCAPPAPAPCTATAATAAPLCRLFRDCPLKTSCFAAQSTPQAAPVSIRKTEAL